MKMSKVNTMAASKSKAKGRGPVAATVPQDPRVEQLINDLRHGENEMVRSSAAGELGHMKAAKAVSPLIAALKDTHPYVRHGAAWALGEIGADRAVGPLKEAMNDDDEITRGKAAEALGKIESAPKMTM